MHDPDVLVADLKWFEVWHREPNDADSGTICPRAEWKWHPHHWRLNSIPLKMLRRRLLTRCAWCGGPSRKGDPVNNSRQQGGPRAPWWRGEIHLTHRDCSSVQNAHLLCYCDIPDLSHGDYGQCRTCEGHRAWRKAPTAADRLLRTLPIGARIPAGTRPEVERLWAEARAVRQESR